MRAWLWALAAAACCAAATSVEARADISTNMNKLSVLLQQEMGDVLELAAVNYSEPVLNATYYASVEFDMRAMGPLYNSTHLVIDFISQKEAYPEGIVSVSDHHLEVASVRSHWKPLLSHYAGPSAVLVCALLVAAILPLVGLFWCCCYWCRVGRRRRPFDRKYDACLKGILAIVLIGLLTLFLFGVVCLFATDSQTEAGTRSAAAAVRTGARDTQTFLEASSAHAHHLLVTNYGELAERLDALLRTSGAMVSLKLSQFSRAVSVSALSQLVDKLDDVKENLKRVQRLTAELRTKADELNTGLRKVKHQLLQTLAKCTHTKCIQLQDKYRIGQLDTEIQYSQMPDVSELVGNVSAVLQTRVKEEVAAGQQVFRDIQAGVRRSVQDHIPAVQQHLQELGRRLREVSEAIARQSKAASGQVGEADRLADTLDELHAHYGGYRTHAGRAAAAVPLLVVCMMAWGLVCGVCGKRPDVYGANDCCNKGQGSKCLTCGVCVIFLLGGCLAAVLAVYFLVGFVGTRFICDPLTLPRNNRLFGDLEVFVNLEQEMFHKREDPNFNMTFVLINCHQNKTIYESLQLHRVYDVSNMSAEVSRAISDRIARLQPQFPPATTILRSSAREKLRQLADSGLSEFDFERILQALETNMTSLALDQLANQLSSTARALQRPALAAEADSLEATARELQQLQRDTVQPMYEYSSTLNATAIRLRDELRFNHSSLKEAINHLMQEAVQAERFLNTEGPERLKNLTAQFAAVVELKVSEYLARVVAGAHHEVGRCGPLSNAYNATRDAFCNKILMPVNGYWMAMSWCVLLFVPLVVVAQRLARLYLHLDPYPGPLVEAEYLYDAYADRDNVPLANGSKRSTLDIEGKIAEWRERGAAAVGATPSAPPAPGDAGDVGPQGTQLVLAGEDVVVCALLPPPALITDLKSRLDAKDEDNESAPTRQRSGAGGRGAGAAAAGARGQRGAGAGARRSRGPSPPIRRLSTHTTRADIMIWRQSTGKKGRPATTDLLSTSDHLPTTIQDQTIDSKVALTELDEELLKY